MKRTYTSVEWQSQLDELTSAAEHKYPHYGFDAKGNSIFYEYCRYYATLARIDGEYEIADELEALPIKHMRLFNRQEV